MGLDGCAFVTAHSFFEQSRWLVPGFVGERKGAPVYAEQMLSADVDGDLESFGGVGVLGTHEPAGLVGADGEDSYARRAAAAADLGEDFAVLPGGVAGAVDAA